MTGIKQRLETDFASTIFYNRIIQVTRVIVSDLIVLDEQQNK